MHNKTILQLEAEFDKKIKDLGYINRGLFEGTYQGDKQIFGRHVQLSTTRETIPLLDKITLGWFVTEYYGEVSRVRTDGPTRYSNERKPVRVISFELHKIIPGRL